MIELQFSHICSFFFNSFFFSRALHECFYAYCWALSHPQLLGSLFSLFLLFLSFPLISLLISSLSLSSRSLTSFSGWTGKRIVITGDSAGGNLAISLTMLAIANQIRVPDFLFPIYPALLALSVPSPSRLLSIMDPLLGISFHFILFHFISFILVDLI